MQSQPCRKLITYKHMEHKKQYAGIMVFLKGVRFLVEIKGIPSHFLIPPPAELSAKTSEVILS